MLKTIARIVLATLISTMLLTALGMSSIDFDKFKKDNDDVKETTAAVTTVDPEATETPADPSAAPEGTPGCDEDLSGNTEAPEVTTPATTVVTEPPMVEPVWPEGPGAE